MPGRSCVPDKSYFQSEVTSISSRATLRPFYGTGERYSARCYCHRKILTTLATSPLRNNINSKIVADTSPHESIQVEATDANPVTTEGSDGSINEAPVTNISKLPIADRTALVGTYDHPCLAAAKAPTAATATADRDAYAGLSSCYWYHSHR